MTPEKDHPGQGHRGRLRDKFLCFGLEKFTDEEVLELLLTLATPRRDCKQQARRLMQALGSLQAVLDADPQELAKVDGIGPKNILGLKLVPAVARRYLKDRLLKGGAFLDAAQAVDYLVFTMRPLKQEIFKVIFLDAERRVRAVEDLFSGTLDESVVYPREVVGRALALGSQSLVCVHNHPTAPPTPSAQDRQFTRQLFHACRGVSLKLVDHLIVSPKGVHSFAQAGEIRALEREYEGLSL